MVKAFQQVKWINLAKDIYFQYSPYYDGSLHYYIHIKNQLKDVGMVKYNR